MTPCPGASPVAESTLANMTAALSPLGSDAGAAALSRLAGMVRRQAMTMAIADVFLLLTILFFGITLPASPDAQTLRPARAAAATKPETSTVRARSCST